MLLKVMRSVRQHLESLGALKACLSVFNVPLAQIGRGTVSLASVFDHSYQESAVSIVTKAGKHIGEVHVFFVWASKQVSACFAQLQRHVVQCQQLRQGMTLHPFLCALSNLPLQLSWNFQ